METPSQLHIWHAVENVFIVRGQGTKSRSGQGADSHLPRHTDGAQQADLTLSDEGLGGSGAGLAE